MKKLISLFLSLIVILSCLPVMAGAQAKSEFKINTEKLTALGMLTNKVTMAAKSEVTANDWYTLLASMISCQSAQELIPRNIVPVTDDGQIVGMNRAITVKSAVEAAVRALGYDLLADGEHYNYGLNLGLAKGIQTGGNLTAEDMFKLALNVCEAEVMQISLIDEGFAYTNEDKETLLMKYHDIYKIKGILNETAGVAVATEGSREGIYSMIGETVFLTGAVNAKDYLGMEIEAYYREGSDTEGVLLYVEATEKNRVFEITDMEDICIEETTKTSFAYYEGNRTKKIKISKAADMIYNDLANPDFTLEDLMPLTGNLKFIDNDDDGYFDCIIVKNFRTVIVESASLSSERINSKYGEGYELEKYDSYTILKAGKPVSISELKTWNVIYAMEDKEHKNVVLTVSDSGYVIGKMNYIDLNEKEISVNGTVYKINPEMLKVAPAMFVNNDAERTFYLDADGRIAAIGKGITVENRYGWLYKLWNDEDTDIAFMQIFDTEGEWTNYQISEKVKVDGEVVKPTAITTYLNVDQLIRFKTNANEVVTRIETAKMVADGSDSEEFRYLLANGVYRTEDASLGNAYYFGSNMTVFQVPVSEALKGDKKNYSAGGWRYADYTQYDNIEFYDPTRNNESSVLVYRLDPGTEESISSPLFVVEEVKQELIGDDVVTRASGLVVGQHLSITAEEPEVFEGLEPGDAINYQMNSNGRVKRVVVLCKADEIENYSNITGESGIDFHREYALVAQVIDVDAEGNFMKIRGADGTRVIKMDWAAFAIFNRRRNEATDATIGDVQIGDSIIFYVKNSKIRNVCIYRDR